MKNAPLQDQSADALHILIQNTLGVRRNYTYGQVYFALSALFDLMTDNVHTEKLDDK